MAATFDDMMMNTSWKRNQILTGDRPRNGCRLLCESCTSKSMLLVVIPKNTFVSGNPGICELRSPGFGVLCGLVTRGARTTEWHGLHNSIDYRPSWRNPAMTYEKISIEIWKIQKSEYKAEAQKGLGGFNTKICVDVTTPVYTRTVVLLGMYLTYTSHGSLVTCNLLEQSKVKLKYLQIKYVAQKTLSHPSIWFFINFHQLHKYDWGTFSGQVPVPKYYL